MIEGVKYYSKVLKERLGEIRYINILRYIQYNYLNKHIKSQHGKLIPYRGSEIRFYDKDTKIILNGNLKLGFASIGYSYHTALRLFDSGTIIVNSDSVISCGADITIRQSGILDLDGCYINVNSNIRCEDSILIGKNVLIAEEVNIRDGDGHAINGLRKKGRVVIEDNVWIGTRVTILSNVTIGTGAVIGACALVNKSVPERCLAYGIPAYVQKENISWEH